MFRGVADGRLTKGSDQCGMARVDGGAIPHPRLLAGFGLTPGGSLRCQQ